MKINKVEVNFNELQLKNHINYLREKKMSKKTKQINEKYLPEAIDNVYNAVFGLLSDLIKKEPIVYSKYFNYLLELVTNYSKIPTEIEQDGIKSYIIEKLTFDVLELLKTSEIRNKYGIEIITKFIDELFEIVKSVIDTKKIDYADMFSLGYFAFRNYKEVMNEFNDLDNNEISQIAGLIATKIIG